MTLFAFVLLATAASPPATPVTLVPAFRVEGAYAGAIAFAPDGAWATDEQRTVGLWVGRERRRQVDVWPQGTLAFSADGTRLLTATAVVRVADGARIFEVPRPRLGGEGAGAGWGVEAAAWAADGSELLMSSRYQPHRGLRGQGPSYSGPMRKLLVVSAPAGRMVELVPDAAGEVHALAVLPRQFVASGGGALLTVWDRATRATVKTIPGGPTFRHLRVSADGRRLVAANAREVVVYDTEAWSETARWTVLAEGEWISALAVHPTRPLLAVGGWDKKLHVYSQAEPGREVAPALSLPERPQAVAFSPSGDLLLVSVVAHPANFIAGFRL